MIPEMNDKEADIESVVQKALKDNELLSEIMEGLKSKNETLRYNCHKVLMQISKNNGELLYPYWGYLVELLDSKNSYHKMSAVHLIANLAQVDSGERFEGILDKYYNLLDDKSVIIAIYVASASGRIVKAKPHLEKRITDILLNIDKTHHNEERKPLIKGGAIEAFTEFFDEASDKESIMKFVLETQDCDSPKTRKLAKDFLQKWKV
jgi:hypothetical protein